MSYIDIKQNKKPKKKKNETKQNTNNTKQNKAKQNAQWLAFRRIINHFAEAHLQNSLGSKSA